MNLSPAQTAQALPYEALAEAIAQVLCDPSLNVPARQVLALPNGGKLLVMPAVASGVAMTKLITFVADNPGRGLPAIQGDVVVFDAHTGQRRLVLDGPTVTARRTAAVSLLAAQLTAARQQGPMLIVGAGVQGRSHLEAFHQGLGVSEFLIASRSQASAQALVAHAQAMGLQARTVADPNTVLADCPWVATCTSAQQISMTAMPSAGSFISAVGAFTPQMAEWSAPVCQALAESGRLLVDSRDADFEAGDLLQAGIEVSAAPALADVIRDPASWHRSERAGRSVFFHNCGWAGWDLAAALCVSQPSPQWAA
jgi:1-piperideine-2-carboxylate/1-pyrroline-2-carboxylate reductase [NAD(P)H]